MLDISNTNSNAMSTFY